MTERKGPGPARKTNRLADETSPYLLQHARNPVDWYPWGEAAREAAKRLDRPVFLSVGYAACHWCHVMERESFEDEETAQFLNRHFVSVKVDREERPDVDHLYMQAVQALTQRGGWPMTVFLTPDGKPFFGGTYFPNVDRAGQPSFRRILDGVHQAWTTRRSEVEKSAEQLTAALRTFVETPVGTARSVGAADPSPLRERTSLAVGQTLRTYDDEKGGLGEAPKFFHTMSWRLCLRAGCDGNAPAKAASRRTLDAWAQGGICDQLGGGFHRYSTDADWLVPHFEKMLYDNALVAQLFGEAYRAWGEPTYAAALHETLTYLLREMRAPGGAFYATQDADTEGEEGRFYVWDRTTVSNALGDPELLKSFEAVFDLPSAGNWEGKIVLRKRRTVEQAAKMLKVEVPWVEDSIAVGRRKLFEARSERPQPARDEKILVAWNAMAIEAFVEGYRALGEETYLEAAVGAATFLVDTLIERGQPMWQLRHGTKDGRNYGPGFLDDYAGLVGALCELFEATGDVRWLKEAEGIARAMESRFLDETVGDYFYTDKHGEKLAVPIKDAHDGATPSGISLAATAWAKLAVLAGEPAHRVLAERTLTVHEELLRIAPQAVGQLLLVADDLSREGETFILCEGSDAEAFDRVLRAANRRFVPGRRVIPRRRGDGRRAAIFDGKTAVGDALTVSRCVGTRCEPPLVGEAAATRALGTVTAG